MPGAYSPQRTLRPQRWFLAILSVLSGVSGSILPALAQTAGALQLAVHRDWGYGGGEQIQGLFTLEVSGPADLASVTFRIDDQVIGTLMAAPFKLQIDTDRYPLGWHSLSATGQTAAGAALSSPIRRFEFVSASVGFQAGGQIAGSIFGLVAIVFGLVLAVQLLPGLIGRRKTRPLGAPRRYGLKGGCEHCGRWSFVRRAAPEQLAAAERAELRLALPETPVAEESAADRLQRQLDESRYTHDS